ncbi:hypothetical protein D3C72_1599120 [compost metagenome]
MRIDREHAARRHQQRIAVGRGLGYDFCAHHAPRAAAVLHHDGLVPERAQALAQRPRDDIGGASRRERNDHAHGPVRPGARRAGRPRGRTECKRRQPCCGGVRPMMLASK